ncbi:Zinc finger protein 555 like protein [Argiope bruennichi]|uniref:Zinc finger protein 555 like protein n=2 Tax=Argiope bruennichi TaxID=94029 RepID=A0A8T0EK12_ARGBR|nr:Zinc finger protein 555 like protein [Argiope bruennichi]
MSNLRRHLQTHESERNHACEYCGKTYVEETTLQKHLLKHTQKSVYQCDSCDKTFYKAGNLEKHALVHNTDRPYMCTICNKGFVRESSLKQHLATHTEDDPHSCDVCGRRFRRLGNFENHLITHTGYTPHVCDICGKKFLQVGSYRRHLRSHNEGLKEATRINLEGRNDTTMYLLQDDVDDGLEDDEDDGSNIMAPEISIREYDSENMILNTMEGETLMIGEPDGQGNVTVIGSACSMEDIQNLGGDGKEYYLIEVKDCTDNGEVEAKVFE